MAVLITPGQWGDAPQFIPVMERVRVGRLSGGRPHTRPDRLGGGKANSSRRTGERTRKLLAQEHHLEPVVLTRPTADD